MAWLHRTQLPLSVRHLRTMKLPAAPDPFGWLDTWMSDRKNVIRFLLARVLVVAAMVLMFCLLLRSRT